MWFRPLAALVFLSSFVAGQDLPGPGEPALQYTDGAFTEPRGSQSTYTVGVSMNVSWHTTYDTSNLWLIVGWSFNTPIQLASNIGQTWYEWEVSTDSTNATEIYAFRVVDAQGTTEEQQGGGFLSAAFWINGLKTTSSSISSTASHVSTSASAPAATSEEVVTSSSTSALPVETAVETTSGLTEGGKIGVGVGVGAGGVGLIALIAGIILFRRSKNSKTQAADSMEPFSQTPQTFPSTPQTYAGTPGTQTYNEYYKPNEMADTGRGAELDAGQGHRFTPEVYSDNIHRPNPAELQG
ncbi:hypothetical protein F4677DRAFT_366086 [Hypoxylon crocopeplum]|nr:hypothetical protein F4677DRAFT_366086 [Hypoxylon crocopeplum]